MYIVQTVLDLNLKSSHLIMIVIHLISRNFFLTHPGWAREAWFSCICSSNFFSAFCSFRFIFVRGSRSEGSWGLPHWKKWCNFPSKCGNLWGYLWVFQKKMVLPLLPPKQPKMIIFSKENLWLLGKPTILGNPPKQFDVFFLCFEWFCFLQLCGLDFEVETQK